MASLTADKTRANHNKPVAKDTMEYRLIFLVCLPVLLVATLAERMTASARQSASASPKSFIGETLEATHRCTSLAFTG